MTTYNVYRNGEKIASGITEKTYKDTGLSPNTEYTYQVSAENSAGESELSDPITVKTDYSEVKSVTVSPKELTFSSIGNAQKLTVTVEPSTAKQTVSWSSSNNDVATVDENGRVVARGNGEATITATSTEKDIKDTCIVTVNVP